MRVPGPFRLQAQRGYHDLNKIPARMHFFGFCPANMMNLPELPAINAAADVIYQFMQPSPQLCWPLLSEQLGARVWVKHENVNPTGAFKVRGGIYYLSQLAELHPETRGVIAATRGNHGQSIAYAAAQFGITAVIVVPFGNSESKNRAMQSLGAELIEYGGDFNEALDHARQLALARNLHMIPSFAPELVAGVATYGLELLQKVPLKRLYVPIGLGSGICGMAAARNALGLNTELIGVVSDQANAYQLSFNAKKPVSTNTANTMADGLAVRIPDHSALQVILDNVSRIVSVSDVEVQRAIQLIFQHTHHIAEGAGAAALAALVQEQRHNQGDDVGVVLTGANIDQSLFIQSLHAAEAAA